MPNPPQPLSFEEIRAELRRRRAAPAASAPPEPREPVAATGELSRAAFDRLAALAGQAGVEPPQAPLPPPAPEPSAPLTFEEIREKLRQNRAGVKPETPQEAPSRVVEQVQKSDAGLPETPGFLQRLGQDVAGLGGSLMEGLRRQSEFVDPDEATRSAALQRVGDESLAKAAHPLDSLWSAIGEPVVEGFKDPVSRPLTAALALSSLFALKPGARTLGKAKPKVKPVEVAEGALPAAEEVLAKARSAEPVPAEVAALQDAPGSTIPPAGGVEAGVVEPPPPPPPVTAGEVLAQIKAEPPASVRATRAAAEKSRLAPEELVARETEPGVAPDPPPPLTDSDVAYTDGGTPYRPGAKEPPPGMKERGFIKTVREKGPSDPRVRAEAESYYTPITNKGTVEAAQTRIATEKQAVLDDIFEPKVKGSAELTVAAQLLIIEEQAAGNIGHAVRIAEAAAAKGTSAGQLVQSFSIWDRLSPEGILLKAAKTAKAAGVQLDDATATDILNQAKKVHGLKEGTRERALETATLLDKVAALEPPSWAQKVGSLQTMAQLLNVKTALRNLIGNIGFAGIEGAATTPLAAVIDRAMSLATGRRTITAAAPKAYAKGVYTGFREGLEDALRGVDTANIASKYELPKGAVFRNKILHSLETAINIELRATDRAFYGGARASSLERQIKALRREPVGVELEEIHNEAIRDGLRATFQDTNALSQLMTGVKRVLNVVGVGKKAAGPIPFREFGLGDFVIKYPKTPANLLMRGIEYSPFGFAETVVNLSRLARGGGRLAQKRFSESAARAIVGTGAIGTGILLHRLGLLRGKASKSAPVRELETEMGMGPYKLNIDATNRFVLSGFNPEFAESQPGDTWGTTDWFQPQAFPLIMGVSIDEANGTDASPVVRTMNALSPGRLASMAGESAVAASEALMEQPLLTGVRRLAQGEGLGGVATTLKGVPASFVPTALAQIGWFVDNQRRSLDDPNWLAEAGKRAAARVPGWSKTLPPQVGFFGESRERIQEEFLTIPQVFANPSNLSNETDDRRLIMMDELYDKTGETDHIPPSIRKSATITRRGPRGEKLAVEVELSPEQQEAINRLVREGAGRLYGRAVDNERFRALPAEKQQQEIANELRALVTAAKAAVLGHNPDKPSKRERSALRKMRESASPELENLIESAKQKPGAETIRLHKKDQTRLALEDAIKSAKGQPRPGMPGNEERAARAEMRDRVAATPPDEREAKLREWAKARGLNLTTQDLLNAGVPEPRVKELSVGR